MDSNLTATQKLDIVLELLKRQNEYKVKTQISNILLENGTRIVDGDLIRILDRMVNDGYIIERKQDSAGTSINPLYLISYYGLLFDNYAAKSLRDSAYDEQQQLEIERLKKVDRDSDRNQTRLNRLTRWLAVGTIALAVMEIIKFLCDIDPCVKEFFQRLF